MPLEHWQAWGNSHPSQPPVPMSDHPHSTEVFPNAKCDPLLAQLCITSSQEQSWAPPSSSPLGKLQRLVRSPLGLLHTGQLKSPQLLLTGHAFQPCYQLQCPLLGTVKNFNILFVLWGPEVHSGSTQSGTTQLRSPPLIAVLQIWPHHRITSCPAGHTLCNGLQDPIDLGHEGKLLAHGQPVVHQESQDLLHRAFQQVKL